MSIKHLNETSKVSCQQDPENKLATFSPTKHRREDTFNEGNTLIQRDTSEELLQPPDGGWGWVVTGGCFIVTMVINMIITGFGVLFSQFLLTRETTSTTTAWIYCIFTSLWNASGLFARPLIQEFGWRPVAISASMLNAAALTITSFSTSAEFLFFSFSLLSGLTSGTLAYICFTILPYYFLKYRGIANALMMAGICTGQFIGPPAFRYLLDEYSFRGAALIIGALILHACAGSSVFQPVTWHIQKYPNRDKTPFINESRTCLSSQKNLNQLSKTSNEYLNVPNISLRGVSHSPASSKIQCDMQSINNTTKDVVLEEPNIKKFYRGLITFAKAMSYDLTLLSSPNILIVAIGATFSATSCLNFIMMMPFAMQEVGHSLQATAWCLSIFSVTNVISVLTASFLSDWSRFNVKVCYLVGHLLKALIMLVFPFIIHDIRNVMVVMGFFGVSIGLGIGVFNLVITYVFGHEKLASVFSVSTFMVAVGLVVLSPIIGYVRDAYASYAASIWMLSAIAASTVVLWLFMPLAERHERKKLPK